ncbi:hypothetical protein D3C87_1286000 [compost metagenome]
MRRAAAFELPNHTDPFCMIAAKARMDAAVGFQGIHHPVRGQPLRVQPAAHVRESGARGKHDGADRRQAQAGLPGIGRPGVAFGSLLHKAPCP